MLRTKKRREKAGLYYQAREELYGVRNAMDAAYSLFNSTADPELVEASILELSALQAKYSRLIRELKKNYEV